MFAFAAPTAWRSTTPKRRGNWRGVPSGRAAVPCRGHGARFCWTQFPIDEFRCGGAPRGGGNPVKVRQGNADVRHRAPGKVHRRMFSGRMVVASRARATAGGGRCPAVAAAPGFRPWRHVRARRDRGALPSPTTCPLAHVDRTHPGIGDGLSRHHRVRLRISRNFLRRRRPTSPAARLAESTPWKATHVNRAPIYLSRFIKKSFARRRACVSLVCSRATISDPEHLILQTGSRIWLIWHTSQVEIFTTTQQRLSTFAKCLFYMTRHESAGVFAFHSSAAWLHPWL